MTRDDYAVHVQGLGIVVRTDDRERAMAAFHVYERMSKCDELDVAGRTVWLTHRDATIKSYYTVMHGEGFCY
jgi:hypothetical protein